MNHWAQPRRRAVSFLGRWALALAEWLGACDDTFAAYDSAMLRATVAEAETVRLQGKYDTATGRAKTAEAEVERLQLGMCDYDKELRAVLKALVRYGCHERGCQYKARYGPRQKAACRCGLAQAVNVVTASDEDATRGGLPARESDPGA